MLVKVWQDKKDDANRLERLRKVGVDIEKTYDQDELAKGKELVFAASGVTKGELFDGVKILPDGAVVLNLHAVPERNDRKVGNYIAFQRSPSLPAVPAIAILLFTEVCCRRDLNSLIFA